MLFVGAVYVSELLMNLSLSELIISVEQVVFMVGTLFDGFE